jgi:hypothetical protein
MSTVSSGQTVYLLCSDTHNNGYTVSAHASMEGALAVAIDCLMGTKENPANYLEDLDEDVQERIHATEDSEERFRLWQEAEEEAFDSNSFWILEEEIKP